MCRRSPAVGEHRGAPGERLLGRGGEGRQAPPGGPPARPRGLGPDPGLPGLHGEPPAGAGPARGPLLGRPPGSPSPASARCDLCPGLRPRGDRGSRTRTRPGLREQGRGLGRPGRPPQPANHVSSSRKGATVSPPPAASGVVTLYIDHLCDVLSINTYCLKKMQEKMENKEKEKKPPTLFSRFVALKIKQHTTFFAQNRGR